MYEITFRGFIALERLCAIYLSCDYWLIIFHFLLFFFSFLLLGGTSPKNHSSSVPEMLSTSSNSPSSKVKFLWKFFFYKCYVLTNKICSVRCLITVADACFCVFVICIFLRGLIGLFWVFDLLVSFNCD